MSEVYINKRDLVTTMIKDEQKNNHYTDEGKYIHSQEHRHLQKVIEGLPAYKNIPVDDVITIVAQLFNEIETLMETRTFHDCSCGDWEETYAEIDEETLTNLRKKYFYLLNTI